MRGLDAAFATGALHGVTFSAAAGDAGSTNDEIDGYQHPEFPASSPHAWACGGTTLLAARGRIRTETVWNELSRGAGAAGSGVSTVFPVPAYQAELGIRPRSADGGALGRGLPDGSGNADPLTGWNVVALRRLRSTGGTSAVAPMYTALWTLVSAQLGHRIGLPHPALYARRGRGFNDVTAGDTGGPYRAGRGWDLASGWGSPDGRQIARDLGVRLPLPDVRRPEAAPANARSPEVSRSRAGRPSPWQAPRAGRRRRGSPRSRRSGYCPGGPLSARASSRLPSPATGRRKLTLMSTEAIPSPFGEGRLGRKRQCEIRKQHDEPALRPSERRGQPAGHGHRTGGRAERRFGRRDPEQVMQRRQGQFAADLRLDDLDSAALSGTRARRYARPTPDGGTDRVRRPHGDSAACSTGRWVRCHHARAHPSLTSLKMRIRDVVYATSRPSPSTTSPADRPMRARPRAGRDRWR